MLERVAAHERVRDPAQAVDQLGEAPDELHLPAADGEITRPPIAMRHLALLVSRA